MIAASAADIDGISILFGQQAYWTYHHTFGHNLFTAAGVSTILAAFVHGRKGWSFLLFLVLFHLHLVMDYFGSGPDWHIHYLWPWQALTFKNPAAWEFYSWQNMVVFLAFLIWTLWIIRARRRTPLELLMPRLDTEVAQMLSPKHRSS